MLSREFKVLGVDYIIKYEYHYLSGEDAEDYSGFFIYKVDDENSREELVYYCQAKESEFDLSVIRDSFIDELNRDTEVFDYIWVYDEEHVGGYNPTYEELIAVLLTLAEDNEIVINGERKTVEEWLIDSEILSKIKMK